MYDNNIIPVKTAIAILPIFYSNYLCTTTRGVKLYRTTMTGAKLNHTKSEQKSDMMQPKVGSAVGCYLRSVFLSVLLYADEMALVSLSLTLIATAFHFA